MTDPSPESESTYFVPADPPHSTIHIYDPDRGPGERAMSLCRTRTLDPGKLRPLDDVHPAACRNCVRLYTLWSGDG